ncbi:malic enzyme-like NAD(P)-binding protein [Simiduia aestuariiviva]|uniref:NADP-dependent malic enzyme n=1 Tax=Simiduia aestuariiviva TaxID=1510459 RepID=A0A839UKU2_9GAMM|nr:malic enzyme-like NAD(P)-binding protein [Simiduia aestuariiviva]MBB3167220.1 malate dehydrogenase (oxaloacetate-decarboxylating)(NADP+) [Simiduia aestuariiviva]
MSESRKQAALDYHAYPVPGKLSIELSKPADTQEDLSLAYSPGVAEPVRAIAQDPENAYKYTGKGNLVAVISNGTAILGLGNLGPLASKPVMEGKGLLFKRFAGINAIDIEVDAPSPEAFIETVANIAISFGGINLEDIKAPECFEIERILKERCDIPVFHDDQHGTAIVTVAGLLNALEVQGKKIDTAKIVCLGAGAAANACCNLMVAAGAARANIMMLDSKGVVHTERDDLNQYKRQFALATPRRTLDDAMDGADVFLGVSGPNLLSADQLAKMAARPVVFACSNPDPEIDPALARSVRSDLIMATGRSDYPNQVNNVLCFPFLFRGALDVRATIINQEMKLAAVEAIRSLAKQPVTDAVRKVYGGGDLSFGAEYIIPKPTDDRLLGAVAAAVARAAVDTGVAKAEYPKHYPLSGVASVKV